MSWDEFKKGFDAWESKTAEWLELWMKSPLVLEPMGAALSASMRLKAARERAMAAWWAAMGLPTKVDQERTLHALNQLESRLLDLEERLETMSEK